MRLQGSNEVDQNKAIEDENDGRLQREKTEGNEVIELKAVVSLIGFGSSRIWELSLAAVAFSLRFLPYFLPPPTSVRESAFRQLVKAAATTFQEAWQALSDSSAPDS
jgi:hypothetical protein